MFADVKCAKIPTEESLAKTLGLKDKTDLGRFTVPNRNYLRLAIRDVARDSNQRTLISALLPSHIGAQHTLWLSILLFAQGIFNSLIYDWLLRHSVAGHATKTYIFRIPFPQPSETDLACKEPYRSIVRLSAGLSLYHTPELLDNFNSLPDISKSFIMTKKSFDCHNAKLDIEVAKLYDLKYKDIEHILENFDILRSKQPEFVNELLRLAKESLS